VRYEEIQCDDAEYLLVAFGSAARICLKTIQLARKRGSRWGMIRPITLWPFPTKVLHGYADKVKGCSPWSSTRADGGGCAPGG